MPDIICVGPKMRSILLEHAASRAEHDIIQRIPECPPPQEIDLGISRRGRREKGEKRAPSAYNTFIGNCMKAKHIKGFGNAAPAMKDCAAEWRKQH